MLLLLKLIQLLLLKQPTSEPTDANLGIGGSLTGELTTTGESDYLVHQIQTDTDDTAGSTSTLNYQYDETA